MKVTSCIDEQILCEILSRLPLKPLVRFKCVCKSWQSLIDKDQWLINLHHRRQSKTSPRLLMMLLPRAADGLRYFAKFESYWTANLCLNTNKEITTTTIQSDISNKDLLVCKQVLKPINGMICLTDERETGYYNNKLVEDHAACLYNIITQEATPWIRSTYFAQVKQWCDLSRVGVSRSFDFGFDPATNEYKVICMWRVSGWGLQKFQGCGEYTLTEQGRLCHNRMVEILTLGKDTAWRRLEKAPPPSTNRYRSNHNSVYVNGSIYWVSERVLVAFDVGSEEYRVMSNLDFIGKDESFFLMELDGHLAIKTNVGDHIVNLWILDCDKNTCNKWTNEIITLPFNYRYHAILVHSIVDTDNLILECYEGYYGAAVLIHHYNRKKKTFNDIKITGDGSPVSLLSSYIDHPFYMFTTYVESILTLQRSHRPAAEAPDTSSTKTGSRLCYDA